MTVEQKFVNEKILQLIKKLYIKNDLEDEELLYLLDNINEKEKKYLFSLAKKTRDEVYGNRVYLRGLIEFTNYCNKRCVYCGINASNKNVKRYRLTKHEILDSCIKGKKLGFNTFVLQGGEDKFFTDEIICDIVQSIKLKIPDCAVTLSIGEREFESYKAFKKAGVDRYLLRHETTNSDLYTRLHPNSKLQNRMECLKDLKDLGFQTGAGFMVGLPGYETKDYVKDLRFLKNLQPEMVGIGPFIPHADTEMKHCKSGDLKTVILILAMVRLLLPKVLLPATTALSTIDSEGRKKGLNAGANVIMPNLTPGIYREDYSLYNEKMITGSESVEELELIKKQLEDYGYICDMSKGDSKMIDN